VSSNLAQQFLLDPEVLFLNHGSFGACPRPVFEDYQRWQLKLERQPVEFLDSRRGLKASIPRPTTSRRSPTRPRASTSSSSRCR
jgi:isopenicillin-N epimerase